jgi:hypothetical protein
MLFQKTYFFLALIFIQFYLGYNIAGVEFVAYSYLGTSLLNILSVIVSNSGQNIFVSAKYPDGLYKIQSYAIQNGSLVQNITFTEPPQQQIIPNQIMLHSSGKILII